MKKNGIVYVILALLLPLFVSFSGCTEKNEEPPPETAWENPFSPLICGNPLPEARTLYDKLAQIYNQKTLTGQYVNVFENPSYYNGDIFQIQELQAVYRVTKKYPAVLGLDASRFEDSHAEHVLQLAKDYYRAGGIITMCWHWFAPEGETGRGSFYTKDTSFRLAAALADKNSLGYMRLVEDINHAAAMLAVLRDEGIPILWRPLHEASGGWFWWGASGPDAYKELYSLVFTIFNNQYHLNNLIWIWNGQHDNWYVGDNLCDMVGEDIYPPKWLYLLDPAFSSAFKTASSYSTEKKMIALSENSYLPDMGKMFEAKKVWLFWATWCYEFVCVKGESGGYTSEYSEEYVSAAELNAAYHDPRALTLEDSLIGL